MQDVHGLGVDHRIWLLSQTRPQEHGGTEESFQVCRRQRMVRLRPFLCRARTTGLLGQARVTVAGPAFIASDIWSSRISASPRPWAWVKTRPTTLPSARTSVPTGTG